MSNIETKLFDHKICILTSRYDRSIGIDLRMRADKEQVLVIMEQLVPVKQEHPCFERGFGSEENEMIMSDHAKIMRVWLFIAHWCGNILRRLQKHSLAIVYRNQWLNWFP